MASHREMFHRSLYPGDCRTRTEELLRGFHPLEEPPEMVAGVVPHDEWALSGGVAARVWKTLAARAKPRTIIIFGATHPPWMGPPGMGPPGVSENSVYAEGQWETPLGPVEVDAELAAEILAEVKALAVAGADAHRGERSVEVELPFIKAILPSARVVPIAVPPLRNPVQLGDLIGHLTRGRPVAAVASSDLTHYGEERFSFAPRGTGPTAHEWLKANDQRLLALVEGLLAEEIPPEVASHRNACGAGALAAVTAFARARGAEKGIVLEHTTSHEARPEGEFTSGVGYAGVVF